MTGIIGLFTGLEHLQVTPIYDGKGKIMSTVKNTGTQTASIVDVYINGKPCMELGACSAACGNEKLGKGSSILLRPGESKNLEIKGVDPNKIGRIGSGVSVEVKLLTASGKEYPELIVPQEYSN